MRPDQQPSAAGSSALIARALRPRCPRLLGVFGGPPAAVSRTAPTARGPAGGRVRGAGRSTPSPLEILHALVEQPDSDHQPLATADEEPTGHLALTPPIDAPRRPVSRKGRPMKCPVKGRQAGHRRSSPERHSRPLLLSSGRPGVPAAFIPGLRGQEGSRPLGGREPDDMLAPGEEQGARASRAAAVLCSR